MTVTTGVGPPFVIDGPLPEPPEHSLLTIPDVLMKSDDEHWMNGATIYTYPIEDPYSWDPCLEGTERVKAEGSPNPIPYFSSFIVYVPITCSPAYVGDPLKFRQRAQIALEAIESFAVEQVLASGALGSPNPYFTDSNIVLPAGTTPQEPQVGLRYLEDEIGKSGRFGIIHATPATVDAWNYNCIRPDSELNTGVEGVLETTSATHVVSGGGYIGAHLDGHTSPPAGQAWAFATGPVRVLHSEVIVTETIQSLERHENVLTFRAERYVLAFWDTAVQSGVLIDWTQM